MAASDEVSTEIDQIAWWKRHAIELPKWASAFKKILLVQPSSAAAERVFSILQRFTVQQQSSLIFGRLHRTFCNACNLTLQEHNKKNATFQLSCS